MTIREIEEKVRKMRLEYIKEWYPNKGYDISTLDDDDILEIYACLTIKNKMAKESE